MLTGGVVFIVAILFAICTNHAWEDWYITYRASKNLATGNGLVFTVGERVHSFTSPLGTLIPALFNFLTANSSDELVLWLYRVFSCVLLAISGVLLVKIAVASAMYRFPAMVMVGLFMLDERIVDFSINGQETAMMMVLLLGMILLLLKPVKKFHLKLGFVWGGLMWARPDSFVYFGAIAIGCMLFKPLSPHYKCRSELLKLFIIAALVALLVYAPWFCWAWYYYGSPIPHTITAKGLHLASRVNISLLRDFIGFPFYFVKSFSSLDITFMPPYAVNGGWHKGIWFVSRWVSIIAALWCFLPRVNPLGRAISFAFLCAHFYLSAIAVSLSPWYIPNVTVMAVVTVGLMLNWAYGKTVQMSGRLTLIQSCCRHGLHFLGGGLLIASLTMTIVGGYQLKVQQKVIEDSHRKQIGLWLKKQASSPRETVFLECLGYIGFYSQLKMLDFPGMSSPEVVAARRQLGSDSYGLLIESLSPDWLVLRPKEMRAIDAVLPNLLADNYSLIKTFDVADQVDLYSFLPGMPYLMYDEIFAVYRHRRHFLR